MKRPHPLELSDDEMRAMVALCMERIVQHVGTLGAQPMHHTGGGRKLARELREPMPERGRAFPDLVKTLFGRVIPRSLNTAAPGYLGYVPGGGLFHAAVADLVADATNRYVGVWQAGPGIAALETNVIHWFRTLMGLPATGGGVLTTGGSLATLMAVVTARRTRLPENFLDGTLYASDQAHHCVLKAALLAGFPRENVVEIPTDHRFRIRLDVLADRVKWDRKAGRTPFMLVATGGTTNTGAVDDLRACARLARRESLWLHVDAAYGGFFQLTARGRLALRGIERADSVALDPHKGLFLPYGTGCLLVRDLTTLRRAHQVSAAYLPPPQHEQDLWDFSDLSPELSRDWRGLRVWLPLKMHGAGAFRDALDEKLDLARNLATELVKRPHVELVAPPELSLLAFRVVPPQTSPAAVDALNRRILAAINGRQRVFLTGTVAHGMFLIRTCVLSFRTHADRIAMLLEDLDAALAEQA